MFVNVFCHICHQLSSLCFVEAGPKHSKATVLKRNTIFSSFRPSNNRYSWTWIIKLLVRHTALTYFILDHDLYQGEESAGEKVFTANISQYENEQFYLLEGHDINASRVTVLKYILLCKIACNDVKKYFKLRWRNLFSHYSR